MLQALDTQIKRSLALIQIKEPPVVFSHRFSPTDDATAPLTVGHAPAISIPLEALTAGSPAAAAFAAAAKTPKMASTATRPPLRPPTVVSTESIATSGPLASWSASSYPHACASSLARNALPAPPLPPPTTTQSAASIASRLAGVQSGSLTTTHAPTSLLASLYAMHTTDASPAASVVHVPLCPTADARAQMSHATAHGVLPQPSATPGVRDGGTSTLKPTTAGMVAAQSLLDSSGTAFPSVLPTAAPHMPPTSLAVSSASGAAAAQNTFRAQGISGDGHGASGPSGDGSRSILPSSSLLRSSTAGNPLAAAGVEGAPGITPDGSMGDAMGSVTTDEGLGVGDVHSGMSVCRGTGSGSGTGTGVGTGGSSSGGGDSSGGGCSGGDVGDVGDGGDSGSNCAPPPSLTKGSEEAAFPPKPMDLRMLAATPPGATMGTGAGVCGSAELVLEQEVGEGSGSKVWRGRWGTLPVAVKVLKVNVTTRKEALRGFVQEATILAQLRHSAICTLLGTCMQQSLPALVLEYMCGGSLFDLLHNSGATLTPPLISRLALEVATGINYLHQNAVIHRDIKSANVLLDERMHAKVSDFGISTNFGPEHTAETGTYRSMAPEVITHQRYDHLCDVFSYAVLLWEMTHRQIPFGRDSGLQAAFAVAVERRRPEIRLTPVLAPFCDLIQRAWSHDPSGRPTMSCVVNEIVTIDAQVKAGCEAALRLQSQPPGPIPMSSPPNAAALPGVISAPHAGLRSILPAAPPFPPSPLSCQSPTSVHHS